MKACDGMALILVVVDESDDDQVTAFFFVWTESPPRTYSP
jgi:hypothetical protein